jgi:anti-sigma factor RsiW
MRCFEIQELLKADYLDGEVNQEQEQFIKKHLIACPSCRRLEEALRLQRALFQQFRQQEAPERIWRNIRQAIMTERLNQEESSGAGILERLKNFFFAPRPVYVLARTLSVIIFIAFFAGVIIHKVPFFGMQENGNADLIAYGTTNIGDNLISDFGTSIEEYFL